MGRAGDRLRARTIDYQRKMDEVMTRSVKEVGRRIIDRTPIKTGKAKSNWNVQAGAPDITEREATGEHFLHGVEHLPAQGITALPVFISNSLAYAPALERGNSKQAPSGMVGLTALEWPSIVRAITKKVFGFR